MRKINLLIADDHKLFRKAMVRLVKTFDRVGEIWEAENGKECIDQVEERSVNVVLLDLEMPRMSGVEAAEYLMPRFPDLKIIILTMHDSEKYMLHMLEMGVHSFLLKNVDPEELELAITSVVEKDFYHNDLLTQLLRKNMLEKTKTKRPHFKSNVVLTDREQEILELICQEKAVKEISRLLFISEATVNVHKHNLQTKIGAKSAIGLIRYAYEAGIMK